MGVHHASSWPGGVGDLGDRDALGVHVLTGQGVGSSGEECNLAVPYSYP